MREDGLAHHITIDLTAGTWQGNGVESLPHKIGETFQSGISAPEGLYKPHTLFGVFDLDDPMQLPTMLNAGAEAVLAVHKEANSRPIHN